MKNDKRKLFEAFEKVCGIKLIKENYIPEDAIKRYLLKELSFTLSLEDGINDIDEEEFEFKIGNDTFYGKISMIVNVDCENEEESEFAPGYSECNVVYVEIAKLSIYDEFNEIMNLDNDREFIDNLNKELEINVI
jgi:hypothetical protein